MVEKFDLSTICSDLKSKLLSANSPLSSDLNTLLDDQVDQFENSIYDSLNETIIKGEYVNSVTFLNKLKNFDEQLNVFKDELFNEDLDGSIEEYIEATLTKKIKTILRSSNAYQRFVVSIKDRIEFSVSKIYVNTLIKTRYDFVNLKSQSISLECKIFDANLFVAHCDHFVSNVDKDILIQLEDVVLFLKENSNIPTANILYQKALFIRYKFIFRDIEEQKDQNNEAVIFVANSNGNHQFVSSEFIQNEEFKSFKIWNKYLLNHYEIDNQLQSHDASNVNLTDEFINLNVKELHAIIKFAKDVEKDRNLIIKVRGALQSKLQLCDNEYDKYALKICLNYCYNNEISLLVKENIVDEEEIKLLFNEIKSFNSSLRVKNYFSTAMLIHYKLKKLKSFFESKKVYENFDTCLNVLTECEILIIEYKKQINWVKANYNYIFQLPKKECLIQLEDGSELFVSSSFMLPISRLSLNNKFKDDLTNFEVYKSSIENLNITKDTLEEINKLTKEYNEIKEEFKNNESKKLEVVAIVAAIMTFVAGSIPGFKFINSGVQAIYFTLSLGTSMALFSMVFYAINRGETKLKSLKWPLWTGLGVIVGLWFILFFFTKGNIENSNSKKEFNKEVKKAVKEVKNNSDKVEIKLILEENKPTHYIESLNKKQLK